MNIVFLDFDGVLNSLDYVKNRAPETERGGLIGLDRWAIVRLNTLIAETDAEIVVSPMTQSLPARERKAERTGERMSHKSRMGRGAMKVAIVGSRDYRDMRRVREYLETLDHDTVIVTGCAIGVGAWARGRVGAWARGRGRSRGRSICGVRSTRPIGRSTAAPRGR